MALPPNRIKEEAKAAKKGEKGDLTMRDPKWIVAFPLENAVLCVNCENVGNSLKQCVVCESSQIMPIIGFLNTPKEVKHDETLFETGLRGRPGELPR
jgi:hypothetical protein